MTREERLKFCSICENKGFNPKSGIVCSLTNEVAAFNNSCDDFKENSREAAIEKQRVERVKTAGKKPIRQGRNALIGIGILYVIAGFAEAFIIDGHELLYGIIDWAVAVIFFGLAAWTNKKPLLAMGIGLGVYVLTIALIAMADPSTLVKGILWKVLIIFYLIYGIKNAATHKSEEPQDSGDLLDQV